MSFSFLNISIGFTIVFRKVAFLQESGRVIPPKKCEVNLNLKSSVIQVSV